MLTTPALGATAKLLAFGAQVEDAAA
jgi:hypothetical protein